MLGDKIPFIDQLSYFGGNISGNPTKCRNRYQDLEEFVIEATEEMSKDIRITHCFMNWLSFYGRILSPSKFRSLLKEHKHNPVILAAFLAILKDTSSKKQQWNILAPFVSRAKSELLFPNLPKPKQGINPYFERVGIITYPLTVDTEKFLISPNYVMQHCPEIKFRASGLDPVPADLKAYLEKEKPKSLYEIAKATHHFRMQINKTYKNLSHFGLCDGSLLRHAKMA